MSGYRETNVVEMKFDNSNFEKNTKKTMKTLDLLKSKLDFSSTKDSFSELEKSSEKVKFSALEKSITNIERRFTTMGIAGVTAIQRVTDAAINLGVNFTRSLSGKIIQGGINRALKLEQARFMMQGLLHDTEAVEKIMTNVNNSVDGTAYSLDAAANVAAQFAATGMRAGKKMENTLKGVAGVAAMTGSDYESMGRIFTTVAGNGRLMGDQLLQLSSRGLNAAATITDYLNKNSQGAKFAEEDIRKLVSKGKISFELFSAAMEDAFGKHAKDANKTFTGSLSNIQSALSRIGALFTEPLLKENGPLVKFLNTVRIKINKIKEGIAPFAKIVTKTLNGLFISGRRLLQSINVTKIVKGLDLANSALGRLARALGSSNDGLADGVRGWDYLLFGIKNVFKFFGKIIKIAKKAWNSIFPPKTTKQILDTIKAFNRFTEGLKISKDTADKLSRVFKGLFAVLDIFKMAIEAIFKNLFGLSEEFDGLGGSVLDVAANIGDFLVSLRDAIKEGNLFGKILETINIILRPLIKNITSLIKNGLSKFKLPAIDSKIFVDSSDNILGIIKGFFENVKTIAGKIKDNIGKLFSFETLDTAMDIGIIGLTGKFLWQIDKLIKKLHSYVGSFKKIMGEIQLCLINYQNSIKADIIKKIATSLLEVAAAVWIIGNIDPSKVKQATAVLAGLGLGLFLFFRQMDKIASKVKDSEKTEEGIKKWFRDDFSSRYARIGNQLVKIAASLVIVALGLRVVLNSLVPVTAIIEELGKMNPDQWTQGMISFLIIMTTISGFAYVLGKYAEEIKKTAKALLVLSMILGQLFVAAALLGLLPLKDVATGVGAILVLMGSLSMFASIAGESSKANSNIAATTVIIKNLTKALTKLAASMMLMVVLYKIFPTEMGEAALTMLALVGSIAVMAFVAGKIENIKMDSMDNLSRIIMTLSVSLLILAGACAVMTKHASPTGILQMAASLSAILILLGLYAAALEFIDRKLGGNLSVSIANIGVGLLALSTGILALSASFAVFALLEPGQILAASVAIIGIVAALGFLSTKLITFSGADRVGYLANSISLLVKPLVLAGLAMLSFGSGLMFAALALSMFGTGLGAGLFMLGKFITTLVKSIATALPYVAKKLGEAVGQFALGVAEAMPELMKTLSQILDGAIKIINTYAEPLVDAALNLIIMLLGKLIQYLPTIATLVTNFLIKLWDEIATHVPEIVTAGVNTLGKIIEGIIKAFQSMDPTLLLAAVSTIGIVTALIYAFNGIAAMIPGAIAGALGVGLVLTELLLIISVMALFTDFKIAIEEGGKVLAELGKAIGGFIGNLVGAIAGGVITNVLPALGTALSDFMANVMGFIEGAKNINLDVIGGIASLVGSIILLNVGSILMNPLGLVKFGVTLGILGPILNDFAKTTSNINGTQFANVAAAAKDLSIMFDNMPKHNGLAQLFTGDSDAGEFGEQLESFGHAIVRFAETTKGLDTAVVKNAAEAGKAVSAMADTLPKHDGVFQFFTGDNDLALFGRDLESFGRAIVRFAATTEGLPKDVVDNAVACGKALSGFSENLPKHDGVLQFFTGDNKVDDFGAQINRLGSFMVSFCQHADGIEASKIASALDAMNQLSDITKIIPEDFDEDDLIDFTEAVAKSGTDINKFFVNATDGIDPAKIYSIANALAFFNGIIAEDASNTISAYGYSLVTFSEDIKTFSENIKTTSLTEEDVKKFSDSLKLMTDANMKSSLKVMDKTAGKTNGFGKKFIDSLVSGIKSGFEKLKSTCAKIGVMLKGAIDIDDKKSKVKDVTAKTKQKVEAVGKKIEKSIETPTKKLQKKAKDLGDKGGNSLVLWSDKIQKGAKQAGKNTTKTAVKHKKDIKSATKETIAGQAGLAKTYKSAAKNANKGAKDANDISKDTSKHVSSSGKNIKKGVENMLTSYSEATSANNEGTGKLIKNFKDNQKKIDKASKGKKGKKGKQNDINNFASQAWADLHEKDDKKKKKTKTYTSSVKESTIVTTPSKAELQKIGKSIINGVSYGMEGNSDKIKKSASKLAATGRDAAKAVLADLNKNGSKSIFHEFIDKSTQSDAKKSIADYKKERKDLQKQLKEARKSNDKDSKANAKNIKKELDQNAKQMAKAKKGMVTTLKQAADAYLAFRDKIRESAKSVVNSFEGVSIGAGQSAKQLMANLKSQNKALDNMVSGIRNLKASGISSSLLQFISKQDVAKANEYINSLMTMTESQLKKFNKQWVTNQKKGNTVGDAIAATFVGKSPAIKLDRIIPKKEVWEKVAKESADIYSWTWNRGISRTAKALGFGEQVFKHFVNTNLKETKRWKTGQQALDRVAKAVRKMGEGLYKQANPVEQKEYKDNQKRLNKLEKQSYAERSKWINKRKSLGKKRNETNAKQWDEYTSKANKATKRIKAINAEQEANEKDHNNKLDELLNQRVSTIANSIMDYMSISNLDFENKISNPFEKFEDNDKAFADAQKKYDDLDARAKEAEKKAAEAEADTSTVAARLRAETLRAEADKLRESADKAKEELDSYEKKDAQTLIDNYASHNRALEEFYSNIDELRSMSLDEDMLKRINDMGYEEGLAYTRSILGGGSEAISKLNAEVKKNQKLTKNQVLRDAKLKAQQVKNFGENYKKMLDAGFNDEAINKLIEGSDMATANEQMGILLQMTPSEIEELSNNIAEGNKKAVEGGFTGFKLADDVLDQVTGGWIKQFDPKLDNFVTQFNSKVETKTSKDKAERTKAVTKLVSDAVKDTNLDSHGKRLMTKLVKALGKVKVEELDSKARTKFKNNVEKLITDAYNTVDSSGSKKANKSFKKFQTSGENILKGLDAGLNNKKLRDALRTTITTLATDLSRIINVKWEMNSPSKLTERYGRYFLQGLDNGLTNAADSKQVLNSTSSLADSIVDSLDPSNINPTITPVVDMSEIQNGMNSINDMFDDQAISIRNAQVNFDSGQIASAADARRSMADAVYSAVSKVMDGINNTGEVTMNNTFNIDGSQDPSLVAEQVNMELGRILRRQELVWA